jgi:hypothetical protein
MMMRWAKTAKIWHDCWQKIENVAITALPRESHMTSHGSNSENRSNRENQARKLAEQLK